jgi:putative acetyltransferase
LLGDPDYYRRFGFELAVPLGVLAPNPDWTPHLQLRRLASWTGNDQGTFHYAPAFDEL